MSESADDLIATAWQKIHQKFDGSGRLGLSGPRRRGLNGPVCHGPDHNPIPVNKFLRESKEERCKS